MRDELKSLYVDRPSYMEDVKPDDFLVAVGVKQSNSVYHIAQVKKRPHPNNSRMTRFHLKVYKSDLITAIRRDDDQNLFPITWYKRTRKS